MSTAIGGKLPLADAELLTRFWGRVNRDGPIPGHRPDLGPCWPWTGSTSSDGYGHFRVNGELVRTHRFAYEQAHGNIPRGLDVLHHCDNPPCVNFERHLFVGTHSDNMRDMIAKHRGNKATGDRNGSRLYPERRPRGDGHASRMRPEIMPCGDRNGARLHPETRARGEQNGSSKLTALEVTAIRALLLNRRLSYPAIGMLFGVSKTAIWRIDRGLTWARQ